MKRALLLCGGGLKLAAWEYGVAEGLLEGGVDLRAADVILGTSVGAIVAVYFARGIAPAKMRLPVPPAAFKPDPAAFERFSALRRSAPGMNPELAQAIGKVTLDASTISLEDFLAWFRRLIGDDVWPPTELIIPAVNCATGALVGFRRADGLPLSLALAAANAVPGMRPAVPIRGVPHMDAFVYSSRNAGLLVPFQPTFTLVFSPLPPGAPAAIQARSAQAAQDEVAPLREAGGEVVIVFPEEAELAAVGDGYLGPPDPGLRTAGVARGRALAETLRPLWHQPEARVRGRLT
jgi:NTE family protein